MLKSIASFFRGLFSFWNELSDEVKASIIAAAVKVFEEVFRRYYQANTKEQKTDQPHNKEAMDN